LLFILAIFIIIFIIFCTKGYNSLKDKIESIIHKKFKNLNNKNKQRNIINLKTKKQTRNVFERRKPIKQNYSKKNSPLILNNKKMFHK
jgi:hypothetical protein